MRPALFLFVAAMLLACGDSSNDAQPGADAGDGGADTTPFAHADTGTSPVDDASGLLLVATAWPGACERVVTEVGATEPLYTFTTDASGAPDVVVVSRTDARGGVARYSFQDVTTLASCTRPFEELGQAYLDIPGCPSAMETDLDGDGTQGPDDRDYGYTWGARDELLASDAYEAIDEVYLDARWLWSWTLDGRLIRGERARGAGVAGGAQVELLDDGYALVIDMNGDGRVDERRAYHLDADGQVVRGERSTADPASGALVPRTTSAWRYDCSAP